MCKWYPENFNSNSGINISFVNVNTAYDKIFVLVKGDEARLRFMIHTLSLRTFLHRITPIITKTVQKNTKKIIKIVFIPVVSETTKINKHFWKRNRLHIKYPEISKPAHSNLYLISHPNHHKISWSLKKITGTIICHQSRCKIHVNITYRRIHKFIIKFKGIVVYLKTKILK